jgi:hypothetical protein
LQSCVVVQHRYPYPYLLRGAQRIQPVDVIK